MPSRLFHLSTLLLVLVAMRCAADEPRTVPPLSTTSIKGLQCVVDIDDALQLGVQHVAINVALNDLLDPAAASGVLFTAGGQRFGIHMPRVEALDEQVRRFTEAGVRVYFIVLNYLPPQRGPEHPLVHPKTDLAAAPNRLGAFNTVDEAGRVAFTTVMRFLADRYGRADNPYGRCTDFIIGNEVQSHWFWHNLGEASPREVIDDYARTLRLADAAIRGRNTAARVYVSMDHFWAVAHLREHPGRTMPGRLFLDDLHANIKAGGDFPWCVAFHPYPENLFNPRTWDDTTALHSFDSPRITFKNLEVLTTYLRQPHLLYGGRPREVILSEQGFHAPDSADGERLQAAGFVYAWERIRRIEGITAFILHRHVDHPHEGGLRLGLRANVPGTTSTPGEARVIHEVFRAAGTPDWPAASRFALPIIGIRDWSDVAPQPVTP